MNRTVKFAKRAIDIMVGSSCILGTAPLMLGISFLVKTTSKGPVFYKQRRAGMIRDANGKRAAEFWVYKFRTMVNDAEKKTGAVLSQKGDPRVTKIGRLLRATRLDELPQFINVLRGEMSVVGPRPERPELVENLSLAIPFFEERMRYVKPGITGLAQIKLTYTGGLPDDSELSTIKDTLLNPFDLEELKGALADDMRMKLLYDLAYSASLESFTTFLKTDLDIIMKTPAVMFLSRTGQ